MPEVSVAGPGRLHVKGDDYEGVIVESKLVGHDKENVKLGDRVKAVFQQTHDPAIKLPCFELAG